MLFCHLLTNITFFILDILCSDSNNRGSPVTPQSHAVAIGSQTQSCGRGPARLMASLTRPEDK